MPVYFPWNKMNLDLVMRSYYEGNMPVLDLELSALCKHYLRTQGCIYCDSKVGMPHRDELTLDEILSVIVQAHQNLDLQWIYFCGLGEPTDDPKFEQIVETCAKIGIQISMFTNGLNITKRFANFLYQHNVCLLVKCDSLNPEVFSFLLGADDEQIANRVYKAIDIALNAGYGQPEEDGSTRLALSIVPTQVNKNDIVGVVKFALENNLFPLLGQLEYAGRGRDVFDTLALSKQELLEIKMAVEEVFGEPYQIPVCPAGIPGMHIDNIGQCVVHQATGLSCPWFDLKEPRIEVLGNIRRSSPEELWDKVQDYRRKTIGNVPVWLHSAEEDVFGGCGGRYLVDTYLKTWGDALEGE